MAVELRNEIHSRLGLTLQITDFLGDATIASVARSIVKELAVTGGSSLTSTGHDGSGAPAAIQPMPRAVDAATALLDKLTVSASVSGLVGAAVAERAAGRDIRTHLAYE